MGLNAEELRKMILIDKLRSKNYSKREKLEMIILLRHDLPCLNWVQDVDLNVDKYYSKEADQINGQLSLNERLNMALNVMEEILSDEEFEVCCEIARTPYEEFPVWAWFLIRRTSFRNEFNARCFKLYKNSQEK